MLQAERRSRIIERVTYDGRVAIGDPCRLFGASTLTARRDLAQDVGPTTLYLARALHVQLNLTIITGSLPIGNGIADHVSLSAAQAGREVVISDCAATDAQ